MERSNTPPIPVLLTGQALRSLRDSGYTLAAAIGEVVDNSIEANANHIVIRMDESSNPKRKKHIHRIAVADDGRGMDLETLHHYPQIGFSTRYMSSTTIGKYGVGAKLAALNFAERLDVWSRTSQEDEWRHVFFDLCETEGAEATNATIAPPDDEPLPLDLVDLIPLHTGTLVVWSKIDRLEDGRHASDANGLRVEVQRELSRMFRQFLAGGISIQVNGTALLAHDPLFLTEQSWSDSVLSKHYRKKDTEPAFEPKQHYPATVIADERLTFAGSHMRLRVTVYPPEVLRRRGMGGDSLAEQLRVPENLGAISFVRLDREINYTNVPKIFPLGVLDHDRFIGIEVSFTPDLDEHMGVRNVKRGVEPHGDLRALIRTHLGKWIPQARDLIQSTWGETAKLSREHEGEHSAILEAVKKMERTLPKSKVKQKEADESQILEELARDAGYVEPETQANYIKAISNLPFVIETVDFPGSGFIDVRHLSHQTVIRLNERHAFYQELWAPIREIADAPPGSVSGDEATRTARRTVEALTLLVIAYAKAESMDPDPTKFEELRDDWGKYLRTLMGKVKDVL